MFGKKISSDPPESGKPKQSQSLSQVNLSGSMVQLGQTGGDMQQSQSGSLQAEQSLTAAEVTALLGQLETAIQQASLEPTQQEELLDYLRPAKRETTKEKPNKQLIGQNLQQVSQTLKTLKETTEAGKSLWQTGAEVLKTIAPWLGIASHFFGL